MTAAWAWIVVHLGPWVLLLTFGVLAAAFLVLAVAMVEATRRQRTAAEVAIGIFLVLVLLSLALLCGLVAWHVSMLLR